MIPINYLGVVLATVVSMVVGYLWYSPFLFGKTWQKLRGLTPESMKEMQAEAGKAYAISTVFGLITAFMLAHVLVLSQNYFHYSPMTTAFSSALSMWFGFVMPTQATATLFGNKKWALFSIDTGYQLVALIAMGLVLSRF